MSWKDAFNSVEIEDKIFAPITDGNYDVEFYEVKIKQESEEQAPIVATVFKIISNGDFAGQKMWVNYNLGNSIGAAVFKKNCKAAGIDVSADNLEGACSALWGLKVSAFVKAKPNPKNPDKPYYAVYVSSPLAAKQDDSIPF